jgi:hypothetical protein
MDVLPTKYLPEFLNSTATPFIDSDKRNAGYVRSAGKGAGNVAYMAIYEAGHMVSRHFSGYRLAANLIFFRSPGSARSASHLIGHAAEMARGQAVGARKVMDWRGLRGYENGALRHTRSRTNRKWYGQSYGRFLILWVMEHKWLFTEYSVVVLNDWPSVLYGSPHRFPLRPIVS